MEAIKDNGKKIIRIPKDQYFVKYSFIPDPKGGFYDIGFGRLLESLGETIDTTINQMLDAGHLQNAGGGFIGTGIRLKKGGQIKVSPGRYEQVETSGKLGDQIHMHQHQGPSPVLFQLLGMMVEASKDITAVKDILTGDTGGKVQTATTTLAMIEQGLKVFTAIYKRIYRALKDEFRLLFELNARHIDEKAYYTFNDEQEVVEKSDYDLSSMDICPVADPKMVTDMQRAGHAQLADADCRASGVRSNSGRPGGPENGSMTPWACRSRTSCSRSSRGRARPNRPSLRNCSPRPPRTWRAHTRNTDTVTATATDVVWTASGGNLGSSTTGRYVSIYDDTSAADNLLCSYDYGATFTVATGETFTLDFGASLWTLA
jgi:hypothetical protein